MNHHLIKEKDSNGKCIYCGNKLNSRFKSENDSGSRIHYISRKCSHCGKPDRKKTKAHSGLTHSELEKILKK